MIIVALVLFAVVALAPLAWTLRRSEMGRGRRDSALRIQRAQLTELDRDLEQGRIAPAEHATAKLEIQRRVLATAEIADPDTRAGSPLPLLVALIAVPAVAAGLYFASEGRPELPAAPLKARLAEQSADSRNSEELVAKLRDKLATMDQTAEVTRQGYQLLGNAEDRLGHLPAATEAWRKALAIRFDPGLAALIAEAQSQIDGHVSFDSAALFRRALAEAPSDAPWRKAAEDRLATQQK